MASGNLFFLTLVQDRFTPLMSEQETQRTNIQKGIGNFPKRCFNVKRNFHLYLVAIT